MMQLQDGVRSVGAQGGREAGQTRKMPVIMGAKLAREALPAILHRGGASHGQAETTLGPHGEPAEFLVTERSVGMALLVGQRRKHEPVLHRRTVLEGQGFKQGGHERQSFRRTSE